MYTWLILRSNAGVIERYFAIISFVFAIITAFTLNESRCNTLGTIICDIVC